jgi:hypothetical protein
MLVLVGAEQTDEVKCPALNGGIPFSDAVVYDGPPEEMADLMRQPCQLIKESRLRLQGWAQCLSGLQIWLNGLSHHQGRKKSTDLHLPHLSRQKTYRNVLQVKSVVYSLNRINTDRFKIAVIFNKTMPNLILYGFNWWHSRRRSSQRPGYETSHNVYYVKLYYYSSYLIYGHRSFN